MEDSEGSPSGLVDVKLALMPNSVPCGEHNQTFK